MIILGTGMVVLFLIWIQRVIYTKLWNKDLSVSISFSKEGITEGELGEIIEVIENGKHLPLPMIQVKFQTSRNLRFENAPGSSTTDQYYRNEIFQINGREKVTRKIKFEAEKRGYYQINNIDILGRDLFFQQEMQVSSSTECYIYVYPAVFQSEEFFAALHKLSGDILVRRHFLEDPLEHRGIREYQSFDDLRSVNWKATAKTADLKVNLYNYTAMQTVRIFLNTEDTGQWKKYREREKAIQITLGIAEKILSQGIRVSFYTNGKDIMTEEHIEIAGGGGISQLQAIRKALARIDTEKETESFAEQFEQRVLENEEGYFNVFISPNGYDSFQELLGKCESEKIEYRWFYPVFSSDREEAQKHIVDNRVFRHTQFITLK